MSLPHRTGVLRRFRAFDPSISNLTHFESPRRTPIPTTDARHPASANSSCCLITARGRMVTCLHRFSCLAKNSASQTASTASRQPPVLSCTTAFSLLELLISVALIIVMFVMLWSRGSRSHQAQLKQLCAQNLQHQMLALQTYALEHTNIFPIQPGARSAEEPLSLLVPKYTTVTAHFICPGSKDRTLPEATSFKERRISYAYYMGQSSANGPDQPLVTDAQVNTQPKRLGQPLFATADQRPGNNHHRYGGNILFVDGHIDASPPAAAFDLIPTNRVILLNPRP